MIELMKTHDLVVINYVRTLLEEEGLFCAVFDRNIAFTEGSIDAFAHRVMIRDEDALTVKELLAGAEVDAHLNPSFRSRGIQGGAQGGAANKPTDDAFLDGKLKILQPQKGYRAAIDAVCLAASIPAKKGDLVLDVGFGVGVAGLCLAWRQRGVKLTGLEIQEDLVELATENIRRNVIAGVDVIPGDILSPPSSLAHNSFDFVMTNPPFYDASKAISPPDQSKSQSHMHQGPDALEKWLENSIQFVKPRGTFTMVYLAEALDTLLAILGRHLGDIAIFPLWPGNDKPAKRVILSGQKDDSGPVRLLQGLRLHAPPKRYAPEAEEILRHGRPILLQDK